MGGQVIACHSIKEWIDNLEKAKDSKKMVVMYFTATWCGPCKIMAPLLDQISEAFTHVVFLKVDVDELQIVAEEWGVDAMPTFIVLKEGNVVEKVVGATKKDQLEAVIAKHAPAPAAASAAASAATA